LGVNSTTGTVTLTHLGVNSVAGSTYIGVSASTGSVQITNLGVQTLTAGTDTSVSAATGLITVWNNSTLQSITSRGSASTNAIQITNATQATSISTGSLVVSGGVGVSGNIFVGSNLNVTGVSTFTGGTLFVGASTHTGNVTVQGILTVDSSLETVSFPAITANAVDLNFEIGNVFELDSTSTNITANYINVPITDGLAIETKLVITQGATAYIPSAVTINTVAQTILWQGGTPPTGNSNKLDIVSFTFINNGTTTPRVIGNLSTFG
jgi:hypothetical protein